MNLLIDVGNTNLRWAMHGDREIGPGESVRHSGGAPLDLLAAWERVAAPERVLMANVGGAPVGTAIARAVRAYWGIEPELAATRAEGFGVRVAYAEPSRLGVDRWLALVAARDLVGGPCLIVDAGTAATFDLLLADGTHLGGLILPGVHMMRESLLAGTHIPRVEPEPAAEPWATDTGTAVATGSLHALAALAVRLHDRLCDRLDPGSDGYASDPPAILLAGGDGPRLAPLIDRPHSLVPDLVLRGLARLSTDERRVP
jgi:type III pantothenate kinase